MVLFTKRGQPGQPSFKIINTPAYHGNRNMDMLDSYRTRWSGGGGGGEESPLSSGTEGLRGSLWRDRYKFLLAVISIV